MFSMIGDWQQSGLSQKAFCAQHGIRYHVFHYWYKN
ncbi:IS66 family insertion sequence element accessory protein TnpA, partial [Foetidibacter luteolus]